MKGAKFQDWLGPAAGSLLVHVVGVALGIPFFSGDFVGDLTGDDQTPVREPVTLRITAAPIVPEPMETEPPMPEQPQSRKPEPVVAIEEPTPMPPEPLKKDAPPEILASMAGEAPGAESVPTPLPEPMAEAPKPDAFKPARPAAKLQPSSNPPAAKPAPPKTSPGRTAQRASGAMRLCTPADYLRRTAIRYPDEARNNGWQGQVMLAVALDAEGSPTSVEVRRSSGHDMLDGAACRAVAGWRFRPERVGSIAVPSRVLVPVRFAIE